MNREQIVRVVNTVCDYLGGIANNNIGFINIRMTEPRENVNRYEITSIMEEENRIVVSVKLYYNELSFAVMRYYFLEKNGEEFTLIL